MRKTPRSEGVDPYRLRKRADRRRLRALFAAGERLEAQGLLDTGGAAAPRPRSAASSLQPVWSGSAGRVPLRRASRAPRALRRAARLLLALAWPWTAFFRARAACVPRLRPPGLAIWLGEATGLIPQRAGLIGRGRSAVLTAADLGQNLLVLGGIGSGKTTSVIQPILLQCLAQGIGGLVFDVKGDFGVAAAALARAAGRTLTVIGPKRRAFHLLRGLTPEAAAGFLKSALLLSGTPPDPFWTDTAVELCRNALGVLSFLPEYYTLNGLYDYLFHDDARARLDRIVRAEAPGLSPQALRLLRSYQAYHEGVFTRFDAKVASGVLASVAQVLTPFTHPDLVDAFCPQTDVPGMEALARSELLLVDLPLAVWGMGAKVVYTFLKLRFFQYMQRRSARERAHPLLFLCDEYQEIVSANKDGLSDLSFWDKARAFGTLGVVSAQSVASVYAALGDRDLADTLLQNFRQKLCLRTEDPHTLRLWEALFAQRAPAARHDPLIPPRLIRRLHPRQALAVLTIAGQAVEDVIDLPAVFVDPGEEGMPARSGVR